MYQFRDKLVKQNLSVSYDRSASLVKTFKKAATLWSVKFCCSFISTISSQVWRTEVRCVVYVFIFQKTLRSNEEMKYNLKLMLYVFIELLTHNILLLAVLILSILKARLSFISFSHWYLLFHISAYVSCIRWEIRWFWFWCNFLFLQVPVSNKLVSSLRPVRASLCLVVSKSIYWRNKIEFNWCNHLIVYKFIHQHYVFNFLVQREIRVSQIRVITTGIVGFAQRSVTSGTNVTVQTVGLEMTVNKVASWLTPVNNYLFDFISVKKCI